MLRNGVTGSYGSSICRFLRNLQWFSTVVGLIYIPTSSVREFPFLHTPANTYHFLFLIVAILTRVRWYLIVVLICISLTMRNSEHFFTCLLAIQMSSLESDFFNSFFHFFNRVIIVFYRTAAWVPCVFWLSVPYLMHNLQKYFPILRAVNSH